MAYNSVSNDLRAFQKDKIRAMVTSIAIKNHIDSDLLVRIGICESNLNPQAHNATSTASGLFQWLDSSFIHYALAYELPIADKNDPVVQTELAAKVIADGGLSNWSSSEKCWSTSR